MLQAAVRCRPQEVGSPLDPLTPDQCKMVGAGYSLGMTMSPDLRRPGSGAAHGAPVIGIAGGIGSGKSEVARLLGTMGCVVSHSDDDVREVLARPEVRDTLAQWWGRGVLTASGEVDRRAVARLVFGDEAQRRRLEDLVHPLVEEKRMRSWQDAAAEGSVAAFVIDAPLLFEAGLDRQCDAVIFVDAPEAVRLERVRASRGWDAAELQRREKNQWPLETKRERADHLIINDGDVADLQRRVRSILDEIRAKFAGARFDEA